MTATLIALTGFVVWSLSLLILMEVMRTQLVLTKTLPANVFNPENSNLSPFMQRLARAHANCIEGFPIFGGLMLIALVADKTAVTDSLAYLFLFARIVQSIIHLSSLSVLAVKLRFSVFAVQMVIAAYWSIGLLSV